MLDDGEADQALAHEYVTFLGNCRYQLEEFEVEKGRIFKYGRDDLTEEEKDSITIFKSINSNASALLAATHWKRQAATELSKAISEDSRYSLVKYMLS